MTSWSLLNLGDATLAMAGLERVEALFAADGATGADPEAAVFFRHESEGDLHCELKVYFSPAARAVAESAGAEPCLRPLRAGLSLLLGPESAWTTLFQEPHDR